MRGIKNTTISILALGLLAGSTVGVAAQDEADPMAPSTFTWSYGDVKDAERVMAYADGAEGYTVVALDPRASGEMTHERLDEEVAEEFGEVGVWESRLVNDDGFWVGIGKQVEGFSTDNFFDESDSSWVAGLMMWELAGEGGYDGLSLILVEPYVWGFGEGLWSRYSPSDPWAIIYPSEPPAE